MSDFSYGKEHLCSVKMLPLKLLQCNSVAFLDLQKAKGEDRIKDTALVCLTAS